MSRHPVTVRSEDAADDNAVIGYDPPLRTYFLHAFEDPDTGELGLWLGTKLEEFSSLAELVAAAAAAGFTLADLSSADVADMADEARRPAQRSPAERLGWRLR
ncbi:hypothetical protein NED98_10900 [Sphingomonas sp. MMSM20]|uniref:hypothetical protein n=1 Tax=Sphingomonas lycopersici TaxID=2951807 RepID=UPI00223790DE|nr:hypothetical protein [Sphingomonas lycopersici]MCW6530752.1 hypothetical protein [Sphingomonas lycopersici]